MEIHVENVGRVKKAEVSIGGITVVAGGNASGKSTISRSLYAALSSSYQLSEKTYLEKIKTINRDIQKWLSGDFVFGELSTIQKIEIRTAIRKLFLKTQIEKEDFLNFILQIKSNYDLENLKEESINVLYEMYQKIQSRGDEFYHNYAIQLILNDIFHDQINTENQSNRAEIKLEDEQSCIDLIVKNNKLNNFTVSDNCKVSVKPIYITTSNLIDSLNQFSRGGAPRFSSANVELSDLMMKEFSIETKTAEEYYAVERQKQILRELLNQVLDGELQKKSTSMVFHENWCDADIKLPNIASGMKIFVLLQRLVNNGSLLNKTMLVIDEPETNLHPEWQLKLAELLVLIFKHLGICIYLNSHSPYFIRAVEHYAQYYAILDSVNFYMMQPSEVEGMYESKDVTEMIGLIYDKLAEPFNIVF